MRRRHFLQALSSLPIIAGGLPAFADQPLGESAAGKLLVLIYLDGGNDTYNTVVPIADPRYRKMRPSIALAGDSVIKLNETQGFHHMLAPLMPLWEAKELALVQGIGLPVAHQQHYGDVERLFTGSASDEYLADGWLTRAMNKHQAFAASPLDAIALGELDSRERDGMGPFRGEKLRVVNLVKPDEWLRTRRYDQCARFATPAAAAIVKTGIPAPPIALRTTFPHGPFGDAMRAAVEMAALQPALPVIHVTLNALDGDHHHAFDTHWKQLDYHGDTLRRLADGLAALRNGLKEVGRWDTTLVSTYDEFGRSPRENNDRGTDHGWATTHFVMGGRVRGGFHGQAPELVNVYLVGGQKPVIDYRRLYATVVESWWGGNAGSLFDRRFKPLDLLRA